MTFRLGELFSGPGGLALGAKNAKILKDKKEYLIKSVWANDYDEDTCTTYKNNISDECKVICEDVRKLKFNGLPEIDGLAFGFPCNDFSIVGEQKGIQGEYGPLYTYGVKALEYFSPKWFLAENVGGLSNANEGSAFKLILKKLFDVGYNITPHLYKFENYGVPQARHRIIIVGIRKDIQLFFKVPQITSKKPISAKEAISNPPIPINAPNNELTNQSKSVVERLKHIKPGENAFTAKLPKHLRLNVKGAQISQIYKRLDPNKPSYTVTGSGGGGTHVYHWKEDRALTNRERARLQSFPDDFVFYGSKESVRKQIGMAVPPIGVEIVFNSILKTFANVEYDFIEPQFEPLLHLDHGIKNYKEVEEVQLRLLEKGIKYSI
ncbi:MAG: DNA cytosine methyltransferase [Bacteroidota bacterium]